jgi:CheY-like chemotaxis protein
VGAHDALPTTIVCDLALPDEDGYAVVEKLRRLYEMRGERVCAIAVTASARAEDRVRALAGGFDLYIVKPIDPDGLTAAIAERCRRS